MNEQDPVDQRAREEFHAMQRRLDALEARKTHLPATMLLDGNFLKRAFAVLGHYLVAGLIISIPLYLLFFLFVIAFRGILQ